MTLALPEPRDPVFSAVMVTHGSWALTERAIGALAAHTDREFELVVVDNGSQDETPARLSELRHARVLLNQRNHGFGPATNQGAEHASAELLLLLNSDAFVHPGWLEPMLETIERAPSVGAVVPRQLHPDGSLQEAGVLLAQDGTVYVYGDGDDAERPCYRFRRVVDYGSAACLLIRRARFVELGGFDARYAPAYYEDADLCLRLAQRGSRVIYEPRSTVTHVRYGSGAHGAAADLSERNRALFATRWGSRLQGRPWTFRRSNQQAVIAGRDALATPRVLICARPESAAQRLTRMLLEGWPMGRVSWATRDAAADGFDREAWLRAGVELIEDADLSWLDERLFHYDAVVLGAEPDEPLLDALQRTQPQVARIALSELDGSPDALRARAVALMADAGLAPPPAPVASS